MMRHILNDINGFRDANDGADIIKKLEKIDPYQCTDNYHGFEVDCMTRALKRSRRTTENNLGVLYMAIADRPQLFVRRNDAMR